MSLIVLIAVGLAAVAMWVLLSGLRTVVGQEALGQVRKLARALIRHSARGLPKDQYDLIVQDLLAELESPEMGERPLSQLAMAFNIWLHSSSLRTALSPRSQTLGFPGSFLVWLSGADSQLVTQLPSERAYCKARGTLNGVLGLLSAGAVWSAASYVEGLPTVGAIAAGVAWGVAFIWIERVLMVVRDARSLVSVVPRVLLQILAAAVVALTLELWVFRAEILTAAQASHHGRPDGLVEAVAALQSVTTGGSAASVVSWTLHMTILFFFVLPIAADVVRAITRSELYEAATKPGK